MTTIMLIMLSLSLCLLQVGKTLPCTHKCRLPCKEPPAAEKCKTPCSTTLPCAHACTGTCGACNADGEHRKCEVKVERKLAHCGHVVEVTCSETREPACTTPCRASLPCGHTCQRVCWRCKDAGAHSECKEIVRKALDCGHETYAHCCDTSPVCVKPCAATLKCGHACKGVCGDCRQSGGAGHKQCYEPCGAKMACGHVCAGRCGDCCAAGKHQKCVVPVKQSRAHCKHTYTRPCSSSRILRCTDPCGAQLPCNHACKGKCHDCRGTESHAECKEACSTKLPCGENRRARKMRKDGGEATCALQPQGAREMQRFTLAQVQRAVRPNPTLQTQVQRPLPRLRNPRFTFSMPSPSVCPQKEANKDFCFSTIRSVKGKE